MKPSKAVIAGARLPAFSAGLWPCVPTPRARPAIRESPSRRWLTLKSRYRNTRAKVKTTARAKAVAKILVKTRAKEREAAQPTEASRSSNQTLAVHIGGCLGRFREGGTASMLSQ